MSELTHLDQLEAEAIHMIREMADECEKPVTIWFTGLSGSGKSTLANEL